MNDLLLFIGKFNRAIIAISVAWALCALCGCSTSHSVSDRQVHTVTQHDTIRLTQYKVSRDSVYLHDSVYMEVKGDTVRYCLYRDRWHTSTDTLHDTIFIARQRNESTATTHTDTKVTEVHLSVWETVRNYLICIAIIAACIVAIRVYLRGYTN